jgi:hypothetical protein
VAATVDAHGCLRQLSRSPEVRYFLVIQMSDARNKRVMTLFPSPFDCFMLGLEGAQDVIRVVLDNEIVNWTALGATLRAGLNVNVRHANLRLGKSRAENCTSAKVRLVRPIHLASAGTLLDNSPGSLGQHQHARQEDATLAIRSGQMKRAVADCKGVCRYKSYLAP